MPGLIRGVARVAAVAGTASAVSGRVQRRQSRRFAAQDAQAAPQEQPTAAAQVVPPQRIEEPAADKFAQLKTLGDLKAQGVLTEEEFAQEKAKLLAD